MVTAPAPPPPSVSVVSSPCTPEAMVTALLEFWVMLVEVARKLMVLEVRLKFPDGTLLKVKERAVRSAARVMFPAAPTPGFPPKMASSPSDQVVLLVPPSVVQLVVAVFQVPAPLSICPLLEPENRSQVLVAAGADEAEMTIAVANAAANTRGAPARRELLP